MLKFRISPSVVIESYFSHQCQRNMLYAGVRSDKSTRTALGFTAPDGRGDDTAARAGHAWELRLAGRLKESGVLVCRDEKDPERKFNTRETAARLRETAGKVKEDGCSRYIYQGKLHAGESFLRSHLHIDESLWRGTDPLLTVEMSEPETDFLMVWKARKEDVLRGYTEGRVYVSVIDAKLAKRMKLEHKVQVAFYIRLLKCFTEEHGIPLTVDERSGYLWNYDREEPAAFSLSEIDDILEDYLRGILPETIGLLHEYAQRGETAALAGQMDVCVGKMCEYCENYRQCRKHLEEIHSVQLLPYLSGYAQRYLKRMELPRRIEDFITVTENEEVAEALRGNRSWEKVLKDRTVLEVERDALAHGEETDYDAGRMWRNARSFYMPRWQDIALILTAQKDVGADRVYALGYRIGYLFEERRSQHTEAVFIARDRSEEAWLENALAFAESLREELLGISGSGRSLQAYVMDAYEKENLEELLYDLLQRDIPDLRQQAILTLILWLQGERVVTDVDQQPSEALACPVIVLSAELQKLLALPLSIAYTLPELRSALRIRVEDAYSMAKEKSGYNDREYFGIISNAIPSKPINDYWDGKRDDVRENLGKHIIKRFVLEDMIRSRLQSGFLIREREGDEEIARHLLGRLNPFELPGKVTYRQPLLRKWMFQAKYESLLACHRIREARQQDQETALEQGTLMELVFERVRLENNAGFQNRIYEFRVLNADRIRRTDWYCGLLRKDTPEAKTAAYEFDDHRYPPLAYADTEGLLGNLIFMRFERRGNTLHIVSQTPERGRGQDRLPSPLFRTLVQGQHLFLSERFSDLNIKKLEEQFDELDGEQTSPFLDAAALSVSTGEAYTAVREDVLAFSHMEGAQIGFTASQEAAFRHMFENTLTVLQGPPGTGKTDFIARAVITLCRYYRGCGRNMSVLISANSHPAIENALLCVRDKLQGQTDILLIKADRMEGTDAAGIEVVDKRSLWERILGAEGPVVVGATGWACPELRSRNDRFDTHPGISFDLVIIDEASQVRAMDAMLCLSRGKTDGSGRYLLVGDDDQLPPILQGHYEKKPGEPYVYGSVFRFFRDSCEAAGQSGDCLMLEDDFRMNEILLRYPAEKIYGSRYRAYNDTVALRHLDYPAVAADAVRKEWLRYVLDDLHYDEGHRENYWPLIFCCIRGADPGRQNLLERRLVTELTGAMWTIYGQADADDRAAVHRFWRGGADHDGTLGIISPHHEHIEKLKRDIAVDTGMPQDELYIGTVDKLQGQQRDAVIVSYGVTDLESAAMESEFIFNRNRLNVSLTRGKAKTIVFFSEILAECPPELLGVDDEDVQRGVDFVCGLMPFMQREEEDTGISMREFGMEVSGKMLTVQIFRKQVRRQDDNGPHRA